jgi:membrane protease YdiL (CAAX protease family)
MLFGGCFVLTSLVSVIVMDANGVPLSTLTDPDLKDQHAINAIKIMQAISTVTSFIVPSILFALVTFTGRYGYFLGFRKSEKVNMYVLAVICILLALPFVILLGDLNQRIPLPESLTNMEEMATRQMSAFLKVSGSFDIFINVLVIGLIPAIGEEICFRGVLQRILIQITRSPWTGIILTAILFSSLHLQFGGFLPRMFLGILLGAFYWYSGSLWTSILAHFVNNASQVILVSYAPKYISENPDTPLLAAIVSGIVVWAIIWFFQRQSTITWSKVYRPDDLTPNNQFLA